MADEVKATPASPGMTEAAMIMQMIVTFGPGAIALLEQIVAIFKPLTAAK